MALTLPYNPDQFSRRIIDGSDSKTLDQLYFIGSARNYVKKVNSENTITVNASGNFYSQVAGGDFRDILDGGDSEAGNQQFLGPIVGGVFPTTKNGI